MNWYRIKANDGGSESRAYVGCSPDSPEALAEKAARGEYIRLEQLLYMDRGEVKDFAEWDKSVVSTVHINPKYI